MTDQSYCFFRLADCLWDLANGLESADRLPIIGRRLADSPPTSICKMSHSNLADCQPIIGGQSTDRRRIFFNEMLCNLFFKIVLFFLPLESGDIETNPGPYNINHSLFIVHSNIRSIRNKFNYLAENSLDFDILCFNESHLDANITTESLIMSSKYDIPYRKDRTNQGGGLLMYLYCELAHTRIIGFETSLWVENKFSNFLCFASFCAHLLCNIEQFQLQ